MKITILTIATNQYKNFFKPFVDSINKYFCTSIEKEILVFSDDPSIINGYNNCFFYPIKHEKWPFVTLKRFETFKTAYDRIQKSDFILYFDVDLEVSQKIDLNFDKIKLLGVQHPAIYKEMYFWPVETNEKSKAYLDPSIFCIYHQGCLWGGSTEEFLKLNDILMKNIQDDLQNNIIALWHDESHLNNYYFHNRNIVQTLPASFAYPENWKLPIEKIIIHKDKNMKEYPRHARA